jgi:predicted phage terminase large subunit-like protein
VRDQVKQKKARRIALVGRTAADVRDVMVSGPSGILAVCPDDERPLYEPSRRRLIWPCGAVAHTYTSEKSDQLRGPQHDLAWCDELAAWNNAYDTWDQLMFGLRLGNPRCVVTTTPRPIKLLKDLIDNENAVVTRGSTFENRLNLADAFFEQIIDRYEGTSIGRQEIYADLLTEVPGALWQRSTIDQYRVHQPPKDLRRIVVAVDPAVTAKDTSDETGIVVVGLGADGDFYVLGDASLRASVDTWARAVVTRYQMHRADKVIAEVNQGGDLVAKVIHQIDDTVPVRSIHASRGKYVRAEPVAARYEQGRVHHVGSLPELEDQLCSFSPTNDKRSPDRMDALV